MFDWIKRLLHWKNKKDNAPDRTVELQKEHTRIILEMSSVLDPNVEAANRQEALNPGHVSEDRRQEINKEQRRRLEDAIRRAGNMGLYASHEKRVPSTVFPVVNPFINNGDDNTEHSSNVFDLSKYTLKNKDNQ